MLLDEDEDVCSELVLFPGEVLVDGAWWDLDLNTEGARKMTTTMPFAVHVSEDGSN